MCVSVFFLWPAWWIYTVEKCNRLELNIWLCLPEFLVYATGMELLKKSSLHMLTVHDLHHCHSQTTQQLHKHTSWQMMVQDRQHKHITGCWILSERYMVQNVLTNRQKTDWRCFQWCQQLCKALHVMDTATNHNKNFNHISVPKYTSFVITNFITSILDNLWLTIWMTQFMPLSLRNMKGKKKMYTAKCNFLRH